MGERAQATVEYAGAALLVLALLLAATTAARARLTVPAGGDAAYLALAAREAPRFMAERGDGEQPVDFRRCRDTACARSAQPVLYVHGLQRNGFTYLEYWEYLPDSRTAHTHIPAFDGYHRDDWEGVLATRMEWALTRFLVPLWLRAETPPTPHANSRPCRPSPATSGHTSRT